MGIGDWDFVGRSLLYYYILSKKDLTIMVKNVNLSSRIPYTNSPGIMN